MRKGKKAAEWMLLRVKSEAYPRMCKQFVRLGLDVPSRSPSAAVCFRNAKFKHKPKDINDTPAFVPAFFDTGRHGHAVFTLGKDSRGRRLCVSVDVKDTDHDERREVGVVPLESLKAWGPWQGWTEDFDGVRVYDSSRAQVEGTSVKSIREIAKEVLEGEWGDGAERKARLQKAGYPFSAVQHEVNILIKNA